MIEQLIQDHIDALNRNTAAVASLAAALSAQPAAPVKRSRAKAEPTLVTLTVEPEPERFDATAQAALANLATDPAYQQIAGVNSNSEADPLVVHVEPAVEEPTPEPEPVVVDNRDVTHEQVMNIVREFRQGLDTANYAKNKADLAVVLKRFGIEAVSKADKSQLPELLIAVKEICQ